MKYAFDLKPMILARVPSNILTVKIYDLKKNGLRWYVKILGLQ